MFHIVLYFPISKTGRPPQEKSTVRVMGIGIVVPGGFQSNEKL
jgi:hypothetical protein